MNLEQYTLVTLTAQHARELRRMIGAPLAPKIAPTASKALMLATLDAAEIDLLQTIATILPHIPVQQATCGHWTLQDLLGHLADWDCYFANWLAGLTNQPTQDLY
ncbi:MAG: hypothetical protein R3C14_54715 [Caldilineaceae bacterium]